MDILTENMKGLLISNCLSLKVSISVTEELQAELKQSTASLKGLGALARPRRGFAK